MPVKTIQLPNGTTRKIEVPEGATNEQILGFVKSQWESGAFDRPEDVFATPQAPQATQQLTPEQTLAASQQAQAGAVPVERTQLEDYAFAVEDAIKKRGQELVQTEQDYQEGKINTPEYILQTAGKGVFGTAADIAGETFMAGAKALTPDFLEQRVGEIAADAAAGVMSSDQWKWAQNHWNELSPRARKNIESALNIGFGAAAMKGVVPPQKLGKKMSVKGMAMKRERLAKQVLPDTATAREQRALNPQRAAAEDRMVNTLMTVDGVSYKNSPIKNFTAVSKELDNIDNTLKTALKSYDGGGFPKAAIETRVSDKIKNLQATNPAVFTDDSLNALYDKMNRLLFDKKVGYVKQIMTPIDILQARRDLDNALKMLSKGATDQSKIFIEAGAQGQIIRAYRDALNEIVDATAKGLGVDSGALRSRSSDLLMARKQYGRMADEKTASIMDMIDRHPIASAAVARGGSSTLASLLAARTGMKRLNEGLPQTLEGTGNILQSPVGAAPAAGLFYTDKEQQ